MHPELSAAVIVSTATIVGALIAAAGSYVSLTLSKDQKVSEFRQAWIEGLRQDLATFLASARAFARAVQESQASGGDSTPFSISAETISQLRVQVGEVQYRIKLRLNQGEPGHQELMRLIDVALDTQNQVFQGQSDISSTLGAIERAASYAPNILKTEWERVKTGESSFRVARKVLPIVVTVVAILFFIYLQTVGGASAA